MSVNLMWDETCIFISWYIALIVNQKLSLANCHQLNNWRVTRSYLTANAAEYEYQFLYYL